MKPGRAARERGVALLALLAVIMLGASWFLVSQLKTESGGIAAIRNNRNAETLNRAKQALIGYVAMQAANSGEDNPGALPCPEAAGYFDNPGQEGQTASSCTLPKVGRFPWRTIGTEKFVDSSGEPLWYVVSPGWARTSGNTIINSNSIGRLTVDGTATTSVASPGNVNVTAHGFAAGDAVSFSTGGTLPTGITAGTTYYVIAAGLTADTFRIADVPAGTAINFTGSSSGSHNVHRAPPGTADSVVALIIAPGPAFSVPACGAIPAKVQKRPTADPLDGNPFPDFRNYLECENATGPTPDATFVTSGPSGSFNDQVVRVTVADIMPGIEAAIAKRIERDIAPQLRSAYAGGSWSATTVLPFAAAFADPSTSAMKGASDTLQGLLPLNYSETSPKSGTACIPGASAPRCDPTFVAWTSSPPPSLTWTGGATLHSSTCSIAGTSVTCTVVTSSLITQPNNTIQFKMIAIANNVGMALRQLNPLATMVGVSSAVLTGVLNDGSGPVAAGSATITVNGSAIVGSGGTLLDDSICGLTGVPSTERDCHSHDLSFPITLLADHPILDSTDATYGWFMRNKWHEVAYYSVASGVAPSGTRSCATNSDCLTVTYHRTNAGVDDAGAQRGVIILAGRTLTGATRPNGTLSDWLEGANADGVSPFELRSSSLLRNRTFNDRIAVLDSN